MGKDKGRKGGESAPRPVERGRKPGHGNPKSPRSGKRGQ